MKTDDTVNGLPLAKHVFMVITLITIVRCRHELILLAERHVIISEHVFPCMQPVKPPVFFFK